MQKLTHQQILDRAVLGVIEQGALSSVGNMCQYRHRIKGRTLRCGVGHLIAPDLYSRGIEGAAADDATPDMWSRKDERLARLGLALIFSGVDVTADETVDLLSAIQSAHDSAEDLEGFVLRA